MSSRVPLNAVAKYTQAIAPISKGTGAFVTKEITAGGFDRALFLVNVGTCKHTGAVLTFSIFNSTRYGGTYTLQAGSLHTMTAPAGAAAVYSLDVPVAADRTWIKMLATGATAWITAGADCILYHPSGSVNHASQKTAKVV
jgi:hypothetical protein